MFCFVSPFRVNVCHNYVCIVCSEPVSANEKKGTDDALGHIDLSTPLRSDELLKNPTHRIVSTSAATSTTTSPTGICFLTFCVVVSFNAVIARGGRGGAPVRGAGSFFVYFVWFLKII